MASDLQPLDGGWGWVIVVCSIINHACTIGLMMSLSVLYVSWLDQFGAGKGQTSWILSVGMASMFGLCVIPANLATKFGFRPVSFVGGILTCVGLTMSMFARSVIDLVVSIGLVTGIGCCFCYLPGVAMVALYFEKRRTLAMGIATAGTGIGAFGFAPLLAFLERTYGWRGALLVLGAISLHMCVTGMLFRPLQRMTRGGEGEDAEKDRDTESQYTVEDADVMCVDQDSTQGAESGDINSTIWSNSQFESRKSHDHVPDEMHSDKEGSCDIMGASKVADHLWLSSKLDKVNEEDNSEVDTEGNKLTDYLELNTDTSSNHIRLNNSNRLFVSLDDFRQMPGKTSHDRFSLHSFRSRGSRRGVNKRIENSSLRNIRNIDIYLLASIRHLLEKNGNDQNWTPLLSPPIDENLETGSDDPRQQKSSLISRCVSSSTLRTNFDMLRDKRFLAFAFSNFLNNLAFMACVVHLVDRAVFHGIDKSVGAIIISANGFGNIFGRLFFGWLANRMCSNHLLMYISTLILCGLGTIASPLCGQFAILHGIFAVFFGCMMGVYVILAPLVTVYLMGVSKVATAYGLVLLFMGPATVIGAPLGGWLFDWTKSYVMSYIVNGIFLLTSGVMLLPLLRGTKNNQSEASDVTV